MKSWLPRLGLALAIGAAVVFALLHRGQWSPERLHHVLAGFGGWAPLVFIALDTLATIVFLPGWIFGLAAGLLFGPWWGTLWSLLGATLGATASFLAARYLVGDWVIRKSRGFLKRLIDGVETEGWRFVALVRLVPLFPFNLSNYALGLTRLRLDHYFWATLLGMVPGTVAYTWLGYAGGEVASGDRTALRAALLALAALALLALLPGLIRRLRRRWQWIDAAALARMVLDGNAAVVDVRDPAELRGALGALETARNIPLAELAARIHELEALRDGKLIIVCRTDKRSARAAEMLSAAGYQRLHVVRGGMEAWRAHRDAMAERAGQ